MVNPGTPDEELVELAVKEPGSEGSGRAVTELLERYQRQIYIWCYRYLRHHEQALDTAQEVMFAAYEKLDTFSRRSPFRSWLFAIARNRCLNQLRSPPLLQCEEHELQNLTSAGDRPDRVLENRLGEAEVLALIEDHLDPVEQEALWLRCFEKMPVDMITEALGVAEASGARAVLQRARRKLRAALERQQDRSPGGKE